jgi:SH3-like domain-containing protein
MSLFSEWTKMRKEVLGIVAAAALLLTGTAFAADASQASFGDRTQVAQAGKAMSGARVRVKSAVLRARPDAKAHKVASLRRGTKLQVIENSGDWTHVKIGKSEGYVMSSLLTM